MKRCIWHTIHDLLCNCHKETPMTADGMAPCTICANHPVVYPSHYWYCHGDEDYKPADPVVPSGPGLPINTSDVTGLDAALADVPKITHWQGAIESVPVVLTSETPVVLNDLTHAFTNAADADIDIDLAFVAVPSGATTGSLALKVKLDDQVIQAEYVSPVTATLRNFNWHFALPSVPAGEHTITVEARNEHTINNNNSSISSGYMMATITEA